MTYIDFQYPIHEELEDLERFYTIEGQAQVTYDYELEEYYIEEQEFTLRLYDVPFIGDVDIEILWDTVEYNKLREVSATDFMDQRDVDMWYTEFPDL